MTFDQFYRFVIPYAYGAPEPAVDDALRSAAIEFCGETNVWNEWQEPQPGLRGVGEYEVDLPDDYSEVAQIMAASYLGRPIDPISEAMLDARYPYSTWVTQTGTPYGYLQTSEGLIRLVPIPGETKRGALRMRVSFRPTQDATELPDLLYTDYAEAISFGALARLLGEEKRTYSSPTGEAKYTMKFAQAKGSARIDVNRGLAPASLQVRMRPFA